RPSRTYVTDFEVVRRGAAGPSSFADLSASGQGPLYVSPAGKRPTVGALRVLLSGIRPCPPGVKGVPYSYYLDHVDTSGLLHRDQHYVVRPGALATVHARFYSDIPGNGTLFVLGVPSELANDPL